MVVIYFILGPMKPNGVYKKARDRESVIRSDWIIMKQRDSLLILLFNFSWLGFRFNQCDFAKWKPNLKRTTNYEWRVRQRVYIFNYNVHTLHCALVFEIA